MRPAWDNLAELSGTAYAVARRCGLQEADARDVEQESALKLLQAYGERTEPLTPRLVAVTARRVVIDRYRKASRGVALEPLEAAPEPRYEPPCPLEHRERLGALWHALERLPRCQQSAVMSRGGSVATRAHRSRALGRLRAALA
jgi:DNA-directed RNA polymerase specialized sigma24 family protein